MIEAFILDVGHGNCTVLVAGDKCIVIDAGHAPTLLDFLADREIKKIDALILSHADEDHIIGAQAILGTDKISVQSVYVNPDAAKASILWDDVIAALEERATSSGEGRLVLEVGHNGRPALQLGAGRLELLSPLVGRFLRGTGGRLHGGRRLTGNCNSIVVRVVDDLGPRLLLAADIPASAWGALRGVTPNLKADVLVVPHHGGRVGRADSDIEAIVRDVAPSIAIISNGRGVYNNPRPTIVAQLRRQGCYVACTQLSKLCGTPGNSGIANPRIPSRGASDNRCCAGSLLVQMSLSGTTVCGLGEHANFVDSIVSEVPLCRR